MNNVVLIGRLTKDPDVRYVPESQMAVCTFTIAVDRGGKDKGADFPKITCFGKTAELVEKYISKGRLVGIQGRIQTGSYKNKEGATVYTTEVVADRVEFLEKGEKKEFKPEDENQMPSGFELINDDRPGFNELLDDVPF